VSEREIDWGSAPDPTPEARDRFTVVAPLKGRGGSSWKEELRQELGKRKDEVRGGSWRIQVRDDAIRILGVSPGSIKELKTFLDECVKGANERSVELDRKLEEVGAAAHLRDEEQRAEAKELGRELRED
jgi:hypothetical protein